MKKPPKKLRATPTAKYLATLKVVDNIPEGAHIGGFEKEFVSLFKKEIIEKCFKKPSDKDSK
jgi:hypothetical protein